MELGVYLSQREVLQHAHMNLSANMCVTRGGMKERKGGRKKETVEGVGRERRGRRRKYLY